MNNKYKTFLFVDQKKIIIHTFDLNNKIIYQKKKVIDNLSKNFNFEIINQFLKENIFLLEKTLNEFITDIYLIIDYDNFFLLDISLKAELDTQILDKKIVNNLISEAHNQCKKTLENQKIIHVKIDKFVIDKNEYLFLPENKKFKNLSVDINFICIPNNLLKKFEEILNNYQISINRIVSFKYLKDFLDPNLSDIFRVALKLTKGLNENEAIITSRNRENQGFFEKFFNFFS